MHSVLITGGAGFFGRAFVKHLLCDTNLPTSRICVYSRNEWNQAQLRAELNNPDRLRWMIGDIRDTERLRRAMEGVDVVVHAAALKRIEVASYNPMEAVATNVLGTENVVNAAIDAGVARAVLLSTDKACNPTTTYGLTKAVAERIFEKAVHYAGPERSKFAICRYGNVSGSTGSVIPVWRRLLADDVTELPVTDPDATRFWMTAAQAVDLVLKAIYTMKGGEMYIPDLPAYRVGDLAQAMGATGMRSIAMGENEKKHEELRIGQSSEHARRMSVEELKEALNGI